MPRPNPEWPQEKTSPRADQYGDKLPAGVLARLGTERLRHPQGVFDVAFAPDGKTFASGGGDGTVRIWETSTGKPLQIIGGHGAAVKRLAYVNEGRELVSVSGDGEVRSWGIGKGKEHHRFSMGGSAGFWFAISPDGNYLASAGGKSGDVSLWDLEKGTEIQKFRTAGGKVIALGFSPNSRLLASAGEDKEILVRDVPTGREICRFKGHEGVVHRIAFSPDGLSLVTVSADRTMRLWSLADAKEVRQFEGPVEAVSAPVFTPTGDAVLIGEPDPSIRIWDVRDGKVARKLAGADRPGPACLAVSPDGQVIVSGDEGRCGIQVRAFQSGRSLLQHGGHEGLIISLAFSPDGKTLATMSSDQTVRLWDAASGKEKIQFEERLKDPVKSLSFSADGSRLVAATIRGMGYVWDVQKRKLVHRLTASPQPAVSCVALSPDGKALAVARFPGTVSLVDLESGNELRRWDQIPGGCSSLAFSPDGKSLAGDSGGRNGPTIQGGKVLVDSIPPAIYVWDVGSGETQLTLSGHKNSIPALAFSPDGRLLAGGCQGYDDAFVWELDAGRVRHRYATIGRYSSCVSFSPDGRLLAIGGDHGQFGIYDLYSRQPFWSTEYPGTCNTLAFSPSGRVLATAGSCSVALLWDLELLTKLSPRRTPTVETVKLEEAWELLASSDDVEHVHQVIGRLVFHPTRAIPFLKERLRPEVLTPEQEREIRASIIDLDSENFGARRQANEQLKKLGWLAKPALLAARDQTSSAEVRSRVTTLLGDLKQERISPERLRLIRAVEVLEQIGTIDAIQVLGQLAKGTPGLPTTTAAQGALDRIERNKSR